MGGEAATAPLKGNAGAAPALHSSHFSTVLSPGFISHRSQSPSLGVDDHGNLPPRGAEKHPQEEKKCSDQPPWEAVGGLMESQGLGDAVLSHSKATLGLNLAHLWGTSSSLGTAGAELPRAGEQGWDPGRSLFCGFTVPRGSPGPSVMGNAPC